MKKISLNEELTRIQEMMGICAKHVSPSGVETNMCPDDDDYEINYGEKGAAASLEEISPSDIVGSMREEETDENTEVLNKFKDQYGDEAGEKVYYATANKQDRDPETFEKNEESAIGGWDLAMEEETKVNQNTNDRVSYLENIFDMVWKRGRGNNDIDFKELAQSTVNDMFGGESEVETPKDVPGFEGTADALDNLGIREEGEGSWMAMRAGKDGKVFENEEMGESRIPKQETYFETQRAALDSAEEYARYKGYEVNWDSVNFEHVGYGQTVTYSAELLKDGAPTKKMLQVSLYRMESGRYELTNYIN